MPINISWQSAATGVQTQLCVPLLNAKLVLTLTGSVVTDASWGFDSKEELVADVGMVDEIKAYLLNPVDHYLELELLIQGSSYAQSVWKSLLEIPVGQVMSYSGLAAKLGSGARAIAQACRNNPYAGIIPCHRVVAKTGIGGFMGQRHGAFITLKQQLLAYEQSLTIQSK